MGRPARVLALVVMLGHALDAPRLRPTVVAVALGGDDASRDGGGVGSDPFVVAAMVPP